MSDLSRAYDRSRVPLYIQVACVLRRRIETNQWHPGAKITNLLELEREFQVARVTVRQAVHILREEGLLRSQQGSGTFAAEKPAERHWFKLATTWELSRQLPALGMRGPRPYAAIHRRSFQSSRLRHPRCNVASGQSRNSG
jgi:DNA-binding GntR family transcriptional regulator